MGRSKSRCLIVNIKGGFAELEFDHAAATGDWYGELCEKFAKENGGDAYIVTLYESQRTAGLYYTYDLCPSGMLATLYTWPETTREEVLASKNELRNTHDVVRLEVCCLAKRVEFELPKMEASCASS